MHHPSMEKKNRHKKGKIASLSVRGDDDASAESKGKEETACSSSSQKGRRIEDTRGRDDQNFTWIRSEDTRGDVSWKRIKKGSKRRRGEVIEIEILNEDLLEDVMLRLPVKSLIRFQNVSKYWRRMITSRSFKDRYMLRHKTKEPEFLCLYNDRSWFKRNLVIKTRLEGSDRIDFIAKEEEEEEEKVEIVSESVDGLFCIYGYVDLRRQINVINPATRWSYRLPFAHIQLVRYENYKSKFALPGFGKDYVTGTYKLVWLHNMPHNKLLSCEVFDLGVNKKWRHVNPPFEHVHYRIMRNLLPTFANGWLYWFTKDKKELVAFDLHKEMFQFLPNPIIQPSSSSSSSVDIQMGSIVDDDGRHFVWISETNGDGMQHVWRLTNHNTGGALLKLDKMLSIDLSKITTNPLSKNGNHNRILFQLLNPTSRIFSYPPSRPCDTSLVPYFPSFVSPF